MKRPKLRHLAELRLVWLICRVVRGLLLNLAQVMEVMAVVSVAARLQLTVPPIQIDSHLP